MGTYRIEYQYKTSSYVQFNSPSNWAHICRIDSIYIQTAPRGDQEICRAEELRWKYLLFDVIDWCFWKSISKAYYTSHFSIHEWNSTENNLISVKIKSYRGSSFQKQKLLWTGRNPFYFTYPRFKNLKKILSMKAPNHWRISLSIFVSYNFSYQFYQLEVSK